ncbi:hypothetical protein EDB85DRAFT_2201412 [Lactarius pseudohatsudake]|nr:hypothetical protein EDB85DRAFT_2201412 [Lactarius pseudohatsudake]
MAHPSGTSCDFNDFATPSTPPPAPAAPRPHHLDLAVTPSTLLTQLQPPPRPRHAAATSTRPPLPTQPRYDASTSAVHLDLHRRRLDIAPTATLTPLRRFHQRRAPRPAPAPSRHSPHSHLDPATTLPPAPRTSTRTGAVSTHPPLTTQPRYDTSTSAVYLDPHRRHLDTALTANSTPLQHFHQRRVPRPAPRRAPRPAPAPSRHSPHSHLDPATTLPPAPRTSTRTGAVSTQPPLTTRPRYDASTSAVYLDPHRRHLDTAPTANSTPLRRFHQRRVPRPAPRRAPQPTPALSRHSPHSHLDPATTLPPAPRTLTRTGAVSTQPPQPP